MSERSLDVAAEVMTDTRVSLLEQLKIEAAVLIPVLEALRSELGRERADQIVIGALRAGRRGVMARISEAVPGSAKQKWEAFVAFNQARVGGDIDAQIVGATPESHDVDVTGCRFADLFRSLDEPELGAALVCECDDHAAVGFGSAIDFRRTQTIMKGANCCDFRFRLHFEEA